MKKHSDVLFKSSQLKKVIEACKKRSECVYCRKVSD